MPAKGSYQHAAVMTVSAKTLPLTITDLALDMATRLLLTVLHFGSCFHYWGSYLRYSTVLGGTGIGELM